MASEFRNLFSRIQIGALELKNRIIFPAISTNYAGRDGSVTERLVEYYRARAAGGAGLIIVECGSVLSPESRINKNQIGLHDDGLIPGLSGLARAVHQSGAKIAFQLSHGGKRATRDITGVQPASPSPISVQARHPDWPVGEIPRPLTVPEIKEIVRAYAAAAGRAGRAGADAVEIHGAHAFLILEFLSPYSNTRTDEYGGTLERRARFASEIVQEIRKREPRLPIIFRISAEERVAGGLGIEDTRRILPLLHQAGVDAFHVATGNHDTPEEVIPPAVYPPAFRVHLAREAKRTVPVPVIASGRINHPELAEEILKRGDADLIAVGRGLLCDPEFPNKALAGKTEEIRRCIACNQGCIDRYRSFDREGNGLMTCALNPTVGREGTYRLTQAAQTRRILVIGGGPAGMEAARVAALRGHKVTLLEKERNLGGQLRIAAVPPFKSELKDTIAYLERQLARLGVETRLQAAGTKEIINQLQPEIVIFATGAFPSIPAIEGGGQEHVVTAWDVLRGRETGKRVVVLGGGMMGCETAEFLAARGKQVTIIEKMANIALDLGPIRRSLLRQRLAKSNVEILTNAEIEKAGVNSVFVDGDREIQTDTVVSALGNKAEETLQKEVAAYLKDSGITSFRVGDCAKSGNLLNAIHSGFDIGFQC